MPSEIPLLALEARSGRRVPEHLYLSKHRTRLRYPGSDTWRALW